VTAAYSSTRVPTSKSQDELRGLLRKFGAERFTFGEGTDPATALSWAGVEFVHADVLVRLRAFLRPASPAAVDELARAQKVAKSKAADQFHEREGDRVWRVLVWTVKARLVAVDEGLESFEQAFLAHLVDPATGRTVFEQIKPAIDAGRLELGSTGLPELGTG
jgi:hypothetical protein